MWRQRGSEASGAEVEVELEVEGGARHCRLLLFCARINRAQELARTTTMTDKLLGVMGSSSAAEWHEALASFVAVHANSFSFAFAYDAKRSFVAALHAQLLRSDPAWPIESTCSHPRWCSRSYRAALACLRRLYDACRLSADAIVCSIVAGAADAGGAGSRARRLRSSAGGPGALVHHAHALCAH